MTEAADFTLQSLLITLMAGGAAGMATDIAIFPIDSIKTRIQASSKKGKDFVKEAEDVSMFQGLGSAMLASFPCTAGFWLAYEYCRYVIATTAFLDQNLHLILQLIIMASVGSFVESLVRNPFEVVKQNMQIGSSKSTTECISNIWKTKGLINGFYAGFGVFIAREIPYCQIQYPLYELLKLATVRLLSYNSGVALDLIVIPGYLNAVNGAISGAISGFLTTPLDVLKTRLMTF